MTQHLLGVAHVGRSTLLLSILVALAATASPRDPLPLEHAPSASKKTKVIAGVEAVENCNDSGSGSLRDALAGAIDGSTIDFSHLVCSEITLTSGPLLVRQRALALIGPGSARLTLSGSGTQQVLSHTGIGTLAISDVAIANGLDRDASVFGGCIYSNGHLSLVRATVHDCIASGSDEAHGGGAFARRGIDATRSAIYANSALATASPPFFPNGDGGGLSTSALLELTESYVGRNASNVCGGFAANYGLLMRDTTVEGNHADATGAFCVIAGVADTAPVDIESSAIIDNDAGYLGGADFYGGSPGAATMRLVNSTVSGNLSHVITGSTFRTGVYSGIYVDHGILEIANSTIAFNSSVVAGAGVVAVQAEVRLESSIIANNTVTNNPDQSYDIDGGGGTITGASNLVMYSFLPLPPDTLMVDPLLLPLADNGGATKTHALAPTSPAINGGSNPLSLSWDQRGAGYRRTVGATDIGAFESQQGGQPVHRGHSKHARPQDVTP